MFSIQELEKILGRQKSRWELRCPRSTCRFSLWHMPCVPCRFIFSARENLCSSLVALPPGMCLTLYPGLAASLIVRPLKPLLRNATVKRSTKPYLVTATYVATVPVLTKPNSTASHVNQSILLVQSYSGLCNALEVLPNPHLPYVQGFDPFAVQDLLAPRSDAILCEITFELYVHMTQIPQEGHITTSQWSVNDVMLAWVNANNSDSFWDVSQNAKDMNFRKFFSKMSYSPLWWVCSGTMWIFSGMTHVQGLLSTCVLS